MAYFALHTTHLLYRGKIVSMVIHGCFHKQQIDFPLRQDIVLEPESTSAKVYYAGENLFTFDSLPFNADPESPSGNLNSYPLGKSHSFGINVTF